MAVYRTVRPIAPEEAALVDMKVNLSQALRIGHDTAGLSQSALAKRLRSSQSRVAKMEAADRTISIDLSVRGVVILAPYHRTLHERSVERLVLRPNVHLITREFPTWEGGGVSWEPSVARLVL